MPALSEDYITDGLLCLDLPVQTGTTFQFVGDQQALRDAEVARKAMQSLTTAEQVARCQAIIDEYRKIQFDTDTITAEGLNSSPFRARARLKRMLQNAIGWNPPEGGHAAITLMRA